MVWNEQCYWKGKDIVCRSWKAGKRRICWRAYVYILALLVAPCAFSVTYTVNDLRDLELASVYLDGPYTEEGTITLRSVLYYAQLHRETVEIRFKKSLFATPQVSTVSKTLVILDDANIIGPGASLLTIIGGNGVRVFDVRPRMNDDSVNFSMSGLTIADTNDTTLDGGAVAKIFYGIGEVRDCVFTNCVSNGDGGALKIEQSNIAMNRCIFSQNIASSQNHGAGGGLYIGLGESELNDCLFERNYGSNRGGGVLLVGTNSKVRRCRFIGNIAESIGGGIYIYYGSAVIEECIFKDNEALKGGGGGSKYANEGYDFVNCTFSGNKAKESGGGFYYDARSSVRFWNCTLVNNLAEAQTEGSCGGGLYRLAGNTTITSQLANTIVAGNSDASGTAPDIFDSYSSLGHNLIGVADGGTGFTAAGDQTGTAEAPLDALLGPLADNGGRTETCLPLAGSPAIDAGDDALVTNPPFEGPPFHDQRGARYLRTHGAAVDIGAVEIQPEPEGAEEGEGVVEGEGEGAEEGDGEIHEGLFEGYYEGHFFEGEPEGVAVWRDMEPYYIPGQNYRVCVVIDSHNFGQELLTMGYTDYFPDTWAYYGWTEGAWPTFHPTINRTGKFDFMYWPPPVNQFYMCYEVQVPETAHGDVQFRSEYTYATASEMFFLEDYTFTIHEAPAGEGEGFNEGGAEGNPEGEGEGLTEGAAEGLLPEGLVEEGEGDGQREGEGAEGNTEGEGEDAYHTGDQNHDYFITLTELLRVIQFFNLSGYYCAGAPGDTEDGYLPGPGENHACSAHDSDYNPQDWRVDLSELLRLIQFFNSSGYHTCPGQNTEDGFCPGI